MNTNKRILLADDDENFRQSFFRDHKEKYLINTVPYSWAPIHCKTQNYDLLIMQDPKSLSAEEVVKAINDIKVDKPDQKIMVLPGPHISFEMGRQLKVNVLTVEDFTVVGYSWENVIDKQLWPELGPFGVYPKK